MSVMPDAAAYSVIDADPDEWLVELEPDAGKNILTYRMGSLDEEPKWPILFRPDPEIGPVRTFTYTCAATIGLDQLRLGIDPAEPYFERVVVATTEDGLPILSSHTYLPRELAGLGRGWRDTAIGQLALPDIAVQGSGHVEVITRVASPVDADALAIPDRACLIVLTYRATMDRSRQPGRVGLLVKAPGHRVKTQTYPPADRGPMSSAGRP